MKKIALSFLFSFILFHAIGVLAQTVKTDAGIVSGIKSTTGVTAYKGIPFAAPPVGDLRWKAPQPAAHWSGVRKCDTFGPSPMQGKPSPFFVWTKEFLIPAEPISEDCLYLNVWTKSTAKEKRPVLVWIYGGGFASGGTAVPIYDGEAMAGKGVVFVSINYRVGVFGFLAHPELTKESPEHASGNYGLMDQIAALRWVKKNIAAFGGDPDRVTIAGQSAGSMSVNALVASPLAKGLFERAIAESGSTLLKNGGHSGSLEAAEANGEKMSKAAGANSLADLRKIPAEELLSKMKGQFGPITDGYVLPESVSQLFAENKQNNVAVITGWNADEGLALSVQKKDDYIQSIKTRYGDKADSVLKYYPAGTDEEAAASQSLMSRDIIFAWSGYKWGELQSSRKTAPIYLYNFTRKPPAEGDFVKYKSFHTAEVPYALADLQFFNRPLQPEDHEISRIMSAYWVNFAATGNPNGPGLPKWPEFVPKGDVMIFSDQPHAGKISDEARIRFMLKLVDGQ